MNNRFNLRTALIVCGTSLAVSGVSAQTPPSNSVRAGANLTGPLKTRKCPPSANCTLRVRAAYVPLDEDDDKEEGCMITTRIGALLHANTTSLTWKLTPVSATRGFSFDTRMVEVDDGGTHFNPPTLSVSGDAATVTLKPGTKTDAFTYSIYLKWAKQDGTSGVCKAYDPIIVSQEH